MTKQRGKSFGLFTCRETDNDLHIKSSLAAFHFFGHGLGTFPCGGGVRTCRGSRQATLFLLLGFRLSHCNARAVTQTCPSFTPCCRSGPRGSPVRCSRHP